MTTRRHLLTGALGGAVLATRTAQAAPVATDERPDVIHHGRALAVTRHFTVVALAGRRTLRITNRRTHRHRTVHLPGQPLELAVRRGLLAVTIASWDHPRLVLLPLRHPHRRRRVDIGPAPRDVAFGPEHLVVTGGEQDGTLQIFTAPDLRPQTSVALGRAPRGVAVHGHTAWVALEGEAVVVEVDLHRKRVTRRLAVPALPDRVTVSPGGHRLLVSHGGHAAHTVSDVDLRTGEVTAHRAGGTVSAVAWARSGRRLAALYDRDAVAVVGPHEPRLHRTVAGPRDLALAGRHAFTVSSVDGAIGRVRA